MVRMKSEFPCKIDINHSRLRSVHTIDDLACIFNPWRNAIAKREAWEKIFREIRDAPGQKVSNLDHLADEYLTTALLWKVRKEMRAIGLIDYRQGQWLFSRRVVNNLRKLANMIEDFMEPVTEKQKKREDMVFNVRLNRGAHK